MRNGEKMTDKQGGMIHFKLHNLPGFGASNWEFEELQRMNADREFTKSEASDLIDWLLMLADSVPLSNSYEAALTKIRDFAHSKATF